MSSMCASVYNTFINHYEKINTIRKFNCKKLYIGAINVFKLTFESPIQFLLK